MTSPIVGSARVEITGDLAAFAAKSQEQIKSAMTGVADTVTKAMTGVEEKAGESGSKAGKAYAAKLKDGMKAPELGSQMSKDGEAAGETAKGTFDRVGRALGVVFSGSMLEGVGTGKLQLARAVEATAEEAGKAGESKFGEAGKRAGEKFGDSAKESVKSLSGAVFAGVGALGVGEIVDKSLEAADQLEASNVKIEGSFGESSEAVKAWAQTMATKLGQSAADAENTAGTFGQMFHAMGIGQEEASGMAEKMDELIQNVAKFNNADPAAVQDAMTAALRGRGKALSALGINMDASTIAAEAMSHGIVAMTVDHTKLAAAQDAVNAATTAQIKVDKTATSTAADKKAAADKVAAAQEALTKAMGGTLPALSASQKAEASYYAILDGTKNQQDAVADSTHTLAQQKKVLGAEVQNLEAKFGTLLLPILTKVAEFVTGKVVPALSTVGHWIAQNKDTIEPLVAVLGGMAAAWKLVTIAQAAFDAVSDADPIVLIGVAVAALAAGLVVAYEKSAAFRRIIDDVGHVLKSVAAGIREAVMFLGFGFTGSGGGLELAKEGLDKFQLKFYEIGNFIHHALNDIVAWAKDAWAALQTAWTTVGKPTFDFIVATVQAWWPTIVNVFHTIITVFESVWGFLETAWENVGKPTFDVIVTAIKVWWDTVEVTFAVAKVAFTVLWDALKIAWSVVGKPVFDLIVIAAKIWWATLKVVFDALSIGWKLLWTAVKVAWAVGKAVFDVIAVTVRAWWTVIKVIFDVIVLEWKALWAAVKVAWSVGKAIFDAIKVVVEAVLGVWFKTALITVELAWAALWGAVSLAWHTVGKPVFDLVASVISAMWSVVQAVWGALVATWDAVVAAVVATWDAVGAPLWGAIQAVISAWWAAVQAVWGAITGVWSGIWDAVSSTVKSVWDTISGYVTTGINAITSVITSVGSSISSAWSTIWNGLSSTVTTVVSGISSTVSGIWDGVTAGLKSVINGGIDIINGAIGFINSKLIDTANEVPFVNIPHIPTIPHLYKGGAVTGQGSSTSDSQLIAASPGEAFVNAKAYSLYKPTIDAMNTGAPIPTVTSRVPVGPLVHIETINQLPGQSPQDFARQTATALEWKMRASGRGGRR